MKNIYINWASYDELSDDVELTEELAMLQLDELIRLKRCGVGMDYYLMDAFWYDADSGFMEWRKPHWPKGPGRWLDSCRSNGIIPGLWLPTNNICVSKANPFKDWKNSVSAGGDSYCMFQGSFLDGIINVMEFWHGRGVSLFKFDFANFDAATEDVRRSLLPHEIRAANETALRSALRGFRRRHPDCILLAYNGFGGQISNTSIPYRKSVDSRWLDCFDAIYCGDPRPADVPCMNFWRSKDIYSDHMVKDFHSNGLPLERIDNSAFMVGRTGTCYRRGKEAWRGMLLLALAKGSGFNTYYGNLDLLDDTDASWMAKAQKLFLPLNEHGRTRLLGGIPGRSEAYGYVSSDGVIALASFVNASQEFMSFPMDFREFNASSRKMILFHDKGFVPDLTDKALTLGPEQLCVIGLGDFARPANRLGLEKDVLIPKSSAKLTAKIAETAFNMTGAEVGNPGPGTIRAVLTQSKNGVAFRSSGGSPPKGRKLGEILKLGAEADGCRIPVRINYDKAIWSGLSWAVGEMDVPDGCRKLHVKACSAETEKLDLEIKLYSIG